MNQHKTPSGIIYYRLVKDETPPNGWARFIVLMKKHVTNMQMPPHFISARSREDAERIVAEDYQAEGHGYLQPDKFAPR
ncbi:MAG: hypothetical protein ABSB74_19060 [Tepidisphaeraceae bacterium]